MIYLKQSTASQSIKLGPFVDSTDGVTAETGLTIANTDIKLSKAGGTMAAKNSGGGTHDADGWYTITLDATDTATVGTLQISCVVAGALPVFVQCTVLEEAIYAALFAESATGELLVDAVKINGNATSASNLAFSAGTIVTGTASGSPTTTTMPASDLPSTVDDHYNGRIIIFTSGTLAGQATDITDYDGSTKTLTFTAITSEPTTNTFLIV